MTMLDRAGSRLAPVPRPGGRFAWLTAACCWAVIILLVMPSGGMEYFSTADTTDGNPVTRVVWLMMLAVGAIVLAIQMSKTLRLAREINIFFLLLGALAVFSVAWSVDFDLSLRRLVRMVIIYGVCLAFGVAAWETRRFQHVVRPVLTLLLAASIAFGLAFPKLAIHQDTASELLNAWHGLAQQKNAFGGMASFAFILWLHAWMTRDTNRLLAVVGGAVSGACIVLSRSSTSLMATIFASLVMMILMRSPGSLRRSLPYLVAALAAVIILYSLAMLRILPGSDLLLSPVPMLTGKDLTFSGRSEIWAAIATHIQQRPILGSGYGAYWSPGTPKPGEESYVLIKILQGFYPASSHNGYLDVLNDLGAIGLLCLGGFLVVYVRQSLRLMKVDRAQGALFVVLFFQQTIDNLSESDWFFVTSLNFMLMSLATVSIARALVEARNPNAARVRRGAPVPVVPRRATVDHSAPPRRLMRPRY